MTRAAPLRDAGRRRNMNWNKKGDARDLVFVGVLVAFVAGVATFAWFALLATESYADGLYDAGAYESAVAVYGSLPSFLVSARVDEKRNSAIERLLETQEPVPAGVGGE